MANTQIPQAMENAVIFYKTLFFDLPLAGAKWGLGIGEEKEATETAWKTYDASVRLATTIIDTSYRAPLFGEFTARSLDVVLRGQRLGTALAGVFFTGLWQAVGLPTASEVQALRTEVQALREDVRFRAAGFPVRKKQTTPVESDKLARKSPGRVTRDSTARSLPAAA